ncbi:metallophosphoesterase, partial [bacterium]|nr:metallophosphoesterase [bacterium]
MKWAIISDVHANLAAFEAVLKAIEKEKPDKMLMLGDVVGYGPDPDACIRLATENVDYSILGNHDAAVSGLMDYSAFNMLAKEAVEWTNAHISEVSKS